MNKEQGRTEREKIHPAAPRNALTWLVGISCLLFTAAVYIYQAFTPSDGARISKGFDAWTIQGVVIHAYPETGTLLQEGDLLVGIDGVDMDAWARALFDPQTLSDAQAADGYFTYQILRENQQLDVPIRPVRQPLAAIFFENWGVILFAVVFQILATFVFLRRPGEPAAAALFLWGMTSCHFYVWSSYLQVLDLVNRYGFWLYTAAATFLWLANWGAGMHLALTFPRQLKAVQKRPALVALPYLASFGLYGLLLALSWQAAANHLVWIGDWQRWEAIIPVFLFLPSIGIILAQYFKVEDEASRIKIRWVVYSGAVAGCLTIFLYLIPNLLGLPGLDSNLVGVIILLFPVSITIAILRHQLFDIDVIIRRTLVYGLLTAALLAIYFGSVILLQQAFLAATGERSQIAIVFSTLAIAALFTPLRRRIQAFIDRRFFRKQYDAELTLQAFSRAIIKEVDLDQLRSHLLHIVNETMQPEHVSLWIREPEPGEPDKGKH
jgi:hypothetical protein